MSASACTGSIPGLFVFAAAEKHLDEGATNNSRPLSEIVDRQATTSYEPLDVMAT